MVGRVVFAGDEGSCRTKDQEAEKVRHVGSAVEGAVVHATGSSVIKSVAQVAFLYFKRTGVDRVSWTIGEWWSGGAVGGWTSGDLGGERESGLASRRRRGSDGKRLVQRR